jgi:hypothetical protein
MSAFELFGMWLTDNILYYALILVVLFAWDIVDLYIEQGNFLFIRKRTFVVYYWVRAFFAITLMEITLALGLLNIESKVILSFVTPLVFSAMLQNLLIKIGGEEGTKLDFSKIFSSFREKILASLIQGNLVMKMKESKRLIDSDVPLTEIKKACQAYAPSSEEFKTLEDILKGLPDYELRIEYSRQLLEWGTKDATHELLKEHRS